MSKKILDSKLLYALLAIVIAIALWFYVAVVENSDEDMETTISGVPVKFVNVEVLEENDLIVSAGNDQTVDLTVRGPRTTLVSLEKDKDKISLTVDVSKITSPGSQRMAYNCTLPSAYQFSVQVVGQSPNNIDFTVSRRIDREIPVEEYFIGSVAEDYMRGEFESLPSKIGVTGIESEVNQIAYARVTIDGTNLTTTVEGEMPFELISYQGEVLTDLDVTLNVDTVYVTMPVIKTADVPLNVKWIMGGGISNREQLEQYVTYEIDPAEITVSGAEEDLSPLKEIVLGEIDLSDIISSDTFVFEIPLNESLENISGTKNATVSVSINGLVSKTMEVDNIELHDVPDGFTAQSVTKTLQVLVRGPADVVDLLLPINLRVVADMSDVAPAAGRYTVPVKVYLDGTNAVGVIGDDYKIVADLIRK